MTKIFESPDKGKTVYERDFGRDERKLVEDNLTEQLSVSDSIQKHCSDLSAKMLSWNRTEYNSWGAPWA